MNKNGTILVAGGTGLIGSACIRYLKKIDYANLLFPTRQEVDYLNYNDFLDYCLDNNVNSMVFAAGKVGGILDNKSNQIDYLLTNTLLGINALRVSLNANLQKVILFGSSCMYPTGASQPFREEDLLTGIMEQTSIGYAISKLVLTQGATLANHTNAHKTTFIPVIPNSCYGPNDNFNPKTSHVLSSLVSKIYTAKEENQKKVILFGTGTPKREFVHSDDVADAVFFLMNNIDTKPSTSINIGSGYEVDILNLAKMICNVIDYNGTIEFDKSKPDGAKRKILDISKINKLGWSPKINLHLGIKHTVDWYINNKDNLNG